MSITMQKRFLKEKTMSKKMWSNFLDELEIINPSLLEELEDYFLGQAMKETENEPSYPASRLLKKYEHLV